MKTILRGVFELVSLFVGCWVIYTVAHSPTITDPVWRFMLYGAGFLMICSVIMEAVDFVRGRRGPDGGDA
jgi:uncharacterized membrane protein